MKAALYPLLALVAGCTHQLASCPTSGEVALNGPGVGLSVWDDGYSTFLQFPGNTPIPVVSTVDARGVETPVDVTVNQGGMVMVHGVAPEIRLRNDNAVACLVNKNFNPIGSQPASGTVRADVVRELRVP